MNFPRKLKQDWKRPKVLAAALNAIARMWNATDWDWPFLVERTGENGLGNRITIDPNAGTVMVRIKLTASPSSDAYYRCDVYSHGVDSDPTLTNQYARLVGWDTELESDADEEPFLNARATVINVAGTPSWVYEVLPTTVGIPPADSWVLITTAKGGDGLYEGSVYGDGPAQGITATNQKIWLLDFDVDVTDPQGLYRAQTIVIGTGGSAFTCYCVPRQFPEPPDTGDYVFVSQDKVVRWLPVVGCGGSGSGA